MNTTRWSFFKNLLVYFFFFYKFWRNVTSVASGFKIYALFSAIINELVSYKGSWKMPVPGSRSPGWCLGSSQDASHRAERHLGDSGTAMPGRHIRHIGALRRGGVAETCKKPLTPCFLFYPNLFSPSPYSMAIHTQHRRIRRRLF